MLEIAKQCEEMRRLMSQWRETRAEQSGAVRELFNLVRNDETVVEINHPATPVVEAVDVVAPAAVVTLPSPNAKPEIFDLTAFDLVDDDLVTSYEELAAPWCKGIEGQGSREAVAVQHRETIDHFFESDGEGGMSVRSTAVGSEEDDPMGGYIMQDSCLQKSYGKRTLDRARSGDAGKQLGMVHCGSTASFAQGAGEQLALKLNERFYVSECNSKDSSPCSTPTPPLEPCRFGVKRPLLSARRGIGFERSHVASELDRKLDRRRQIVESQGQMWQSPGR
eukprot:TRINITY_DN67682_c0_g1_i1.p1 TRINITY_DN67682_c0_g1~~TRINITY_DN67682_c0_g1_i1.p1  ORF type:complete len:326 (-),score=49.48 TRINITY_DN67682_c0_g1_i1:582-1418(-)